MTSKIWIASASGLAALSLVLPAGGEEPRALEIVSVLADRPAGAPGANSVLLAEEIAAIAADHPAEVLNTLPGVNIQMNSGQEHLIALRSPVLTGGAGQGSVLILENGVPTRSPAFGNVNALFELHHEAAEAIEVVRGPGSAKYGSNAVHGLINVLLPPAGGDRGLEARVSASSLGRYKSDLLAANGSGQSLAVSVQKDNGWRDETGLVQIKASGASAFQLGGWDGTAWFSASSLEQETAGFIQGPKAYRDTDLAKTNPDPEAYRNAWSVRAAVRLERSVAGGDLVLTPFVRTQAMDFSQHFLPNGGEEENSHTGAGLTARYERPVSQTLTWRIGGDVDLASGDLKETQLEPFGFFPGDTRFPEGVHYDYTVETQMLALWSELDWALTPRLTLLAGLRGETHHYDYTTDAPVGINGRFQVAADRTDEFDFVTPKLGFVFDAADTLDLYANYARGARAPQASDLYRLQSQQTVADADVETLDSFEIGARGALLGGGLVFDLAAYTADKDNFFFRDSDGLNVSDGSTRHQGVELAANWQIAPTFILKGSASWSDQTYTFDRVVESESQTIRDGNAVDTAPEWLADVTLAWLPNDAFDLEISAEYIGEYFTDPANTREYPGHTVAHLRANYRVDDTLETYLIVRNLFDVAYADRADFAFGNERFFPGEPLNATIGLRKRF